MTDRPGIDAWKSHQSAFDRVRSIAVTLSRPRSAGWIAEEAAVAENTARDHLGRLVEMSVLREVSGEDAIRYEPDPLYVRMRALRELLDGRDRNDLLELRADLQEQVETWRDEYGVGSPAELRSLASRTDSAAGTRELRRVAADWEIVGYRLGLVAEAIEHFSEYTGTSPAPA